MTMTQLERKLFERAVTALVCALAHDEAIRSGADAETLAELRGHWIDDGEEVEADADLREFLAALRPAFSYQQIADILNMRGERTRRGKP